MCFAHALNGIKYSCKGCLHIFKLTVGKNYYFLLCALISFFILCTYMFVKASFQIFRLLNNLNLQLFECICRRLFIFPLCETVTYSNYCTYDKRNTQSQMTILTLRFLLLWCILDTTSVKNNKTCVRMLFRGIHYLGYLELFIHLLMKKCLLQKRTNLTMV